MPKHNAYMKSMLYKLSLVHRKFALNEMDLYWTYDMMNGNKHDCGWINENKKQ